MLKLHLALGTFVINVPFHLLACLRVTRSRADAAKHPELNSTTSRILIIFKHSIALTPFTVVKLCIFLSTRHACCVH